MNRRKLVLGVAGVALLAAVLPLVIGGCGKPTPSTGDFSSNNTKPKVAVSFAPLYCFATNVAGDDAEVKNVMTTTGPHDFNPTEADVQLVSKADIFFIVGLGIG